MGWGREATLYHYRYMCDTFNLDSYSKEARKHISMICSEAGS